MQFLVWVLLPPHLYRVTEREGQLALVATAVHKRLSAPRHPKDQAAVATWYAAVAAAHKYIAFAGLQRLYTYRRMVAAVGS